MVCRHILLNFVQFDKGADIRLGVLALLERPDAAQTHSILPSHILESGFGWFAEGLRVRESLKHGKIH